MVRGGGNAEPTRDALGMREEGAGGERENAGANPACQQKGGQSRAGFSPRESEVYAGGRCGWVFGGRSSGPPGLTCLSLWVFVGVCGARKWRRRSALALITTAAVPPRVRKCAE